MAAAAAAAGGGVDEAALVAELTALRKQGEAGLLPGHTFVRPAALKVLLCFSVARKK